ncbi:hypothetical protein [Paraconexibacter algicola]|uniref:Uncharacterized protein n=1 Tax=Paraconexibacter algicola TaxID=2133960 RepID=A0A2T4UI62_9ACTN|nr:hypothetical protein [Paraconexibacter algicola]PTL58899.1 hypothetical protein C7Y72_04140 [Paraconexibacter algicola]
MLLTGTGGVLLLLAMFLPWFRLDVPAVGGSRSGLQSSALTVVPVLLAAGGALSVAWAARTTRTAHVLGRPGWHVTSAAGLLALIGTVAAVLSPPSILPGPDAVSGFASLVGLDPKPQLGVYLALLAATVITAGGLTLPAGPLHEGTNGPAGNMYLAIRRARADENTGLLASAAMGLAAPSLVILGLVRDSAAVLTVALVTAIAAVLASRVARRGLPADEKDLRTLSRVGQAGGWTVLGATLTVLILTAAVLGQAANDLGAL